VPGRVHSQTRAALRSAPFEDSRPKIEGRTLASWRRSRTLPSFGTAASRERQGLSPPWASGPLPEVGCWGTARIPSHDATHPLGRRDHLARLCPDLNR
jgi:hypothetical protein